MMSLPSATCCTVDRSPFCRAARFSAIISSERLCIVRVMCLMRCTRLLGIMSPMYPAARDGSNLLPSDSTGKAMVLQTAIALTAELQNLGQSQFNCQGKWLFTKTISPHLQNHYRSLPPEDRRSSLAPLDRRVRAQPDPSTSKHRSLSNHPGYQR